MGLTTIPIQKETRDKLREIAKKSEKWDDVINRLYENTLEVEAAKIFFSEKSYTAKEAHEFIDKWQ